MLSKRVFVVSQNDIVCNEAVQKNLLLQGGILVVTSMQKYICAVQICMLYHAKIYAVPCKSLIVKHITKKKYCDL